MAWWHVAIAFFVLVVLIIAFGILVEYLQQRRDEKFQAKMERLMDSNKKYSKDFYEKAERGKVK